MILIPIGQIESYDAKKLWKMAQNYWPLFVVSCLLPGKKRKIGKVFGVN